MGKVLMMGGGGTDVFDTTATAADVLYPKMFVNADGDETVGEIPTKASSDSTISGNVVTVPSGYYGDGFTKTVGTATSGGTTTLNASTSSFTVPAGAYMSSARTVKVTLYDWA